MPLLRIATFALICCGGFPIDGAELIHLASGFDIEAQSHVLNGKALTLMTKTGSMEVLAADVLGFDEIAEPVSKVEPLPVPPASLKSMIQAVAASQASTPEFIRFVGCVAQVESALRPAARSAKGATGLMQLMPATARELGVISNNAEDNVRGGAKYLRALLLRYHNDAVLALAAYNAGPGAVQKYGGVPPYLETRRYIRQVLDLYAKLETGRKIPD